MYQKHHRSDELFTSTSLSFSIFILTLFLIYDKYINNLTSDMDFYLYIAVGFLFLCLFVYTSIIFLLNFNYKRLDIGLDFERECVLLQSGKKTVPFSEIILFGYNVNKKDVRLLINGKLYGFLLDNIVNEKAEALTEEQILLLASCTKRVKHQHLYNYNLMISILMIIGLYLYAFFNYDFTLFGISITTLYLFLVAIVVYLIVDQSNRFRYRKLLEKKKEEVEEKQSDTN